MKMLLNQLNYINLCVVILSFLYFQHDFLFFLNAELFVNLFIFFLFVTGFYYYYIRNKKKMLVEKNEIRKNNMLFIQTILINWKRFQLRNKQFKKIKILILLKEIILNLLQFVANKLVSLKKYINNQIIFFYNVKLNKINSINIKEMFKLILQTNILTFFYLNTLDKNYL